MMSKYHLILGDGNLGMDLYKKLADENLCPVIVPFEIVDRWKAQDFPKLDNRMDVIWHCTGARHTEAKMNPNRSLNHNVKLPRLLLDRAPKSTRLVFFSSLDCAHPEYPGRPHQRTPEPLSEFARQKLQLEGSIVGLNRPLTAYVRLGSLYGEHRPLSTFPGRIFAATQNEKAALSLPFNEVVPTPTEWAAGVLVQAMAKNLWNPSTYSCHQLAPTGSIPTFDLAKLILGRDRKFFEKVTWDYSRPKVLLGGSTLTEGIEQHWAQLWYQYYRVEAYQGPHV